MKRFICFFLVLALMLPLCGCSRGIQDEAVFYYRRTEFRYGSEDGVIVPELRDITGHVGDLSYLVSLYLMGPLDEDLESPFPKNIRLVSVETAMGVIRIELSTISESFTESQYSLACACLTLTCLELTSVSEVTITSGDRSVTMARESLVLYDSITNETTEGG